MEVSNNQSTIKSKAINRIVLDMIQATKNFSKDSAFTVMIVDDFTTKILSAYLTMSELLNTGIFSVEPLYLSRKKYSNFQAIYFVSPTKENMKAILDDFSDITNPSYSEIHLFFPYRILDSCMDILVDEKIAYRIKTMKELNVAFFSQGDCFSIREPHSLQLFGLQSSNDTDKRMSLLSKIKNEMITVFASMRDYPYIQYQNTKISSELASLLNADLNMLNETEQLSKDRKTICLILDRSVDLITPLLHDYNYKSIVYDFFTVSENHLLSIPSESIEGYKLDEKDFIWNKYKNKHIGEVMTGIQEDLDEFLKSDISKAQQKNLDNFDQMIEAIKGRNEYSERVKQLKTHLKICNKIQKVSVLL